MQSEPTSSPHAQRVYRHLSPVRSTVCEVGARPSYGHGFTPVWSVFEFTGTYIPQRTVWQSDHFEVIFGRKSSVSAQWLLVNTEAFLFVWNVLVLWGPLKPDRDVLAEVGSFDGRCTPITLRAMKRARTSAPTYILCDSEHDLTICHSPGLHHPLTLLPMVQERVLILCPICNREQRLLRSKVGVGCVRCVRGVGGCNKKQKNEKLRRPAIRASLGDDMLVPSQPPMLILVQPPEGRS